MDGSVTIFLRNFGGEGIIKLWKKSLNSDGQQFHQYIQNEHLTSKHRTQKEETMTYNIGNSGPGLDVYMLK
jgi:hypothetical protein